uniref:CSON007035 protein n=1 Tax=Culicoides sonorensis TaxID=179676 RepID=A0A336KBC7_CULSO
MSGGKHFAKGSTVPVLPNDNKLVLYSMRFCPFAQRVHLVLDAKNIPYHVVYINLTDKPEWLVQKSPLLKVPALEIPGESEPLIESLVIADYLDEKYPEVKLHSTDPLQKARDRILIERFSAVIGPMYKIYTFSTDNVTEAVREVAVGLQLYEDELRKRGTKFFGGVKPGMLDYMLWPWTERSHIITLISNKYELDTERFAKLIEWRDNMANDPAVKASFLSAENHLKFLETRRTGKPNYDILVNQAKKMRTS